PAFDVALKLGAYLAGSGDSLTEILTRYSRALGVGYQIRDDIDDFQSGGRDSRIETIRPSLLFALAGERAKGAQKQLIDSIWTSAAKPAEVSAEIEAIFGELNIQPAATEMMEGCKAEAMCCLTDLDSIALKSLLRRVISKIFNDIPTIKNRSDSAASG
ncbi:MAG: polyprenyl synthetase family protein, partial [Planctomycetes bacterium]|nr:polyprenyl synthetase family protein [Planctomycetota bacterium]